MNEWKVWLSAIALLMSVISLVVSAGVYYGWFQ
jgi:hypothetical protein